MSVKWKSLTGEIYDISCPQSGKYAGEVNYSSCPRSESEAIYNI